MRTFEFIIKRTYETRVVVQGQSVEEALKELEVNYEIVYESEMDQCNVVEETFEVEDITGIYDAS
jgi:predicted RNase H-like HicB family nuclease